MAIPLFLFILGVFEVSYDLFVQEALDTAVHYAARQVALGSSQGTANQAAFIASYVCPGMNNLLKCGNVAIDVRPVTSDYWNQTFGVSFPTSNGKLNTSGFTFCNAKPSTPMVLTAVYSGPSFLGGLLPGVFSVSNGTQSVHVTTAGVGFVTEPFPPGVGEGGTLC